jgi:methylthioribulose-1-phosphate dehydratase
MQYKVLDAYGFELATREQLINAARHFYNQGWMLGTAGNLSGRLPDGSFWVTASGCPKGELNLDDFVLIYPDGKMYQPSPSSKPSAETSIHQIIYQIFPEAQACYHVHSVAANLVSNLAQGNRLTLPPLEMLKGLGVRSENPDCEMPVFENYLQVSDIAAEIGKRFQSHKPELPALLIRNHGVTVWGSSLQAARNYIELTEYIFRYMVAAKQVLNF